MKVIRQDDNQAPAGNAAPGEGGSSDPLVAEGAALFDQAAPGATDADVSDAQEAARALEQQKAMNAGVSRFMLGGLKAVRGKLAARNEFIAQEWPDAMLQELAEAVPPVLSKHMARLMPMAGAYPEEAALVFAAVPLVVGYISATQRKAEAAPKVVEGTSSDSPDPAAAE